MTLVYLAIAWLAGIALAKAISLPWQVLPLLGLVAFLGLLLWQDDRHVRLGALCVLALALGAGRFLLAVPHFDETSLATYNDAGRVTLEGVVVGEPDERELYTNLRVQAKRLTLPDGTELEVEGLALVKADRYPQRRYGDRVQVEGRLETPSTFEEFSYREYLARQSIQAACSVHHRQHSPGATGGAADRHFAGRRDGYPGRPDGRLFRHRHDPHHRHLGI